MNEAGNNMISCIVFTVEGQCFAINTDDCVRIIRACAITTLTKAPDIVVGVIDFHGSIVPIVSPRILFNFPYKTLQLSDYFLLCHTKRWHIGLIIDSAKDVVTLNADMITKTEDLFYGVKYIKGLMKLNEEIVLINDLDALLSHRDYEALSKLLKNAGAISGSSVS